ncbi:Uncharacterised protein [Chlamydia abortus]|nr:Uncharacterised protein [Chlamydia abortus]
MVLENSSSSPDSRILAGLKEYFITSFSPGSLSRQIYNFRSSMFPIRKNLKAMFKASASLKTGVYQTR